METLYVIPHWFFGMDIILELVFAVITLGIALYSFKIYNLSDQRESKFFGISFLSFSLSYIVWAAVNFFLLSALNEEVRELNLQDIGFLNHLGIYLYIAAFMFGVINLVYTTLKTESKRVYVLLILLTLGIFMFSLDKMMPFYITSAALFLFVFAHYTREYLSNRNPLTLRITIAMGLMFLASIDFIFAANYYLHYVAIHFLHVVAYILLLSSLIGVIRKHEQKKK